MTAHDYREHQPTGDRSGVSCADCTTENDNNPTHTPQAFARLVASMSIEGECILHGHDPEDCPDEDGEGNALDDPCCDIGDEHPCEVYEPSGNDGEIDTLYNLIATARHLIESCDPEGDEEYRKAAKDQYQNDDPGPADLAIEIDDNAIVSRAHDHAPGAPCHSADEDGAYVAAWVWVTTESREDHCAIEGWRCFECHRPARPGPSARCDCGSEHVEKAKA